MIGFRFKAGELDRRIRIERPIADTSFDGAGSGAWELVASVPAQIRDIPPSRERTEDGATIANRPARIRFRYRVGITSAMRIVAGDRVMQIVAGPAELGRRVGIEVVAEEQRPAGNPA